MEFKDRTDENPIVRLALSYGLPPERVVQGSHLNVTGEGFQTATIEFVLTDKDFLTMGGQPQAKVVEIPVKLDAAEGLAALRAALAPGAVLLSPDAMDKLNERMDMLFSPEALAHILRECGAEFSTAEAEPVNSQGVGGHQVQHVDVPEPDDELVMPASVWVLRSDLTQQQAALFSDARTRDDSKTECLIQVDFLDAVQRAKYSV